MELHDFRNTGSTSVDASEGRSLFRLFRGVSWTLAGTVAAQAMSVGGTMLLARFLGKVVFGQFGMLQSTTLMLASIAGAGFGITATRYVSLLRSSDGARVGRLLGMLIITATCTGVLFAVTLAGFSDSFAEGALSSSSLSGAFFMGAPSVVFVTLNGLQLGVLAGFEAFKESALAAVLQAVLNGGCLLLGAHYWGLCGAAAGLSVSGLCAFVVFHSMLVRSCERTGIVITFRNVWREHSAFVTFGLPAALSGIIGNIAIWGCYAITVRSPGGFSELGAMSAANNLRQAILFVPAVLTRVALPINCYEHGRGQKLRSVIFRQFGLTVLCAVLASVVVLVAAPYALRLFGKDFTGDGYIVALFVCVAVCEVAAASLAQALVIVNRLWIQVAAISLWSLVLFAVASTLIHAFRPALAVGIGYLVAWLVSIVIYGVCAQRLLDYEGRGIVHEVA